MNVSRRVLLVGTFAALTACGTKQATDKLVPIAGPDQQPGEPLWSAKTNSFVVGLTDADRAELIRLGPQYVEAGTSGLLALLNQCTVPGTAKGTVGWCPSTQTFTCSDCGSHWSRVGAVLHGPATVGLTLLALSVSANDDVIIDIRSRTSGRSIANDKQSSLRNDLQCSRVYTGSG